MVLLVYLIPRRLKNWYSLEGKTCWACLNGKRFARLFLPNSMYLWYSQYERRRCGRVGGNKEVLRGIEFIQYSHPPFAVLNRDENRKEGLGRWVIA